ncbi:hypothetical protein WJX82_006330 [Trebouxia sp. C0006]
MFRLVYSGEGATQPLVDDSSLTKEQKWQLLFDRNWRNLAPGSKTKWLVYLRKWKKWIDDHPEQPEGYLVVPSTMRFPDKQVGLGVAAMILAPANNAGKANQDAQMTYAALANHPTMPDTLVKTKVMHLMRCSGTVSLAAAACSMDVLRVWGRWARQTSVASTALSPSSTWYGLSWWALQLPAVRFIVGSSSFRQFEQQVINAELECSARPLSPQMTEAFDKISKQVLSRNAAVLF